MAHKYVLLGALAGALAYAGASSDLAVGRAHPKPTTLPVSLCPPGAGLLAQYCGNPTSERSGCPTAKGSQRCKPKQSKKPKRPKRPKKPKHQGHKKA